MKREAKLSFSPDHLKAGVCTVPTAFVSPGECLPGANFNILNGAMFSLFNSKSHRSYEPPVQPYLHPDICSQRDFSSSLWSHQENTGNLIITLPEFLRRHALLYIGVADKLLHGKGLFSAQKSGPTICLWNVVNGFPRISPPAWIMAFIACWSRNAKICRSCMAPPLPCAPLSSLPF